MGRDLFGKYLYAQAAQCFEKANRPLDRDTALAYQKRVDARRQKNAIQRKAAYKEAGEALSKCGDETSIDKDKRALYVRAKECFEHAGEEELAVLAHSKSIDETPAAELLAAKGQWDQAIALVKPLKGHSRVNPVVADGIIEQVRLAWLQIARYE